jgi:hypothetical protein
MNRKFGFALVSAAWLAVSGCEPDPGPAAQRLPPDQNASQPGTIGQDSPQRRDLGNEVGSRTEREAYSPPEPTPPPAPPPPPQQ